MRLKLPKTKARMRREAATWLARLQGDRNDEVERSFRAWYDADPAHSAAFDQVKRSYDQAGLLRHSEFTQEASLLSRAGSQTAQPRYALAAAIALVLLVPAGLVVLNQGGANFGQTYYLLIATKTGEVKQVTLADGSKITLDADSAVRVEFGRSERKATLSRGRARFAVAHDPRPFTVEAGRARIKTAQALFDAELADNHSRVEILSGTAQVATGIQQTREAGLALAHGQGLTAGPEGAETYSVPDGPADWTSGMLQFNGTALSIVAAEANRYSRRKLLLSDSLGDLRVSGAFRSGDTAGLARSLAAAFKLTLEVTAEGNLLLSPMQSPPPRKKNGG